MDLTISRMKSALMKKGKMALLQPNRIVRQFYAAFPRTLYVMDIKECPFTDKKGVLVKARLLAATDCATGKIVCHYYGQSITAEIVTNQTRKMLKNSPDNSTHGVIIHSDRGSEFVSKKFLGLLKEFPHLQLSMSAKATPRDNAVAEALWSTLGYRLKRLWKLVDKGQYSPSPVFTEIKEGKRVWAEFFNIYNNRHKGVRNMLKSPEFAEKALLAAQANGINIPYYHFALNKPRVDDVLSLKAKANICLFRTKAVESYENQTYVSLIPEPPVEIVVNQPASADMEFIKNTLVQITAQNKVLSDQNIELLKQNQMLAMGIVNMDSNLGEKLDTVQTTVDAGFAKKPAVCRKPTVLRSPLGLDVALEIFSLWVKAYSEGSILDLRAICLIVLQRATGCRINELRRLTMGRMRALIATRCIEILNTKRSRKEVKAISALVARQLTVLLKHISILLKPSFGIPEQDELPDSFYIFSSYKKLTSDPLTSSHFIDSVNKFLKECEGKVETPETGKLTSHSCRIGFVTEAFEKGLDTNTVRKLVGHSDVRSTIKYDQSRLPNSRRIELAELLG